MAPYLVAAPCSRHEFDPGVAAGRVAVDGMRQFGDGQAAIAGDCFLRCRRRIGGPELVIVKLA